MHVIVLAELIMEPVIDQRQRRRNTYQGGGYIMRHGFGCTTRVLSDLPEGVWCRDQHESRLAVKGCRAVGSHLLPSRWLRA